MHGPILDEDTGPLVGPTPGPANHGGPLAVPTFGPTSDGGPSVYPTHGPVSDVDPCKHEEPGPLTGLAPVPVGDVAPSKRADPGPLSGSAPVPVSYSVQELSSSATQGSSSAVNLVSTNTATASVSDSHQGPLVENDVKPLASATGQSKLKEDNLICVPHSEPIGGEIDKVNAPANDTVEVSGSGRVEGVVTANELSVKVGQAEVNQSCEGTKALEAALRSTSVGEH